MEGKEPAPGLINTLCNKVGWKSFLVNVLVLKRIMPLRKRHSTRIEPHIDQIGLTVHRLTRWADQNNFIHIGTVQVKVMSIDTGFRRLFTGLDRLRHLRL